MSSQTLHPTRLLSRTSESRCATCPPERVCAWCCVQGTSGADIVIGAVLEQSRSWALDPAPTSGIDAISRALWETYNR